MSVTAPIAALQCPATGELCPSAEYCEQSREGSPDLLTEIGSFATMLPQVVAEALEINRGCVEKQLEGIHEAHMATDDNWGTTGFPRAAGYKACVATQVLVHRITTKAARPDEPWIYKD